MKRTTHIFRLEGLHCASCAAKAESAVAKVDGVESVEVNLVAGLMRVSVDGECADAAQIEAAVAAAGFKAELRDPGAPAEARQKPSCLPWVLSLVFLLPLLALHFHLFGTGSDTALWELLLLLPILYFNRGFFVRGTRAALHAAPNMDTLVALGAATATIYSIVDLAFLHSGPGYADTAAMILTIVAFGNWLEAMVTAGAGDTLAALRRRIPARATILRRDGTQEDIPAEQIMPGDALLVRPGQLVPADGTVLEGVSEIDESAFTGESVPMVKEKGHRVYAGTINGSGPLRIAADAAPQKSALSHIIRMVGEAEVAKPPMARTADRVATWFVPAVIVLACLTAVIWIYCSGDTAFALRRAISVLVVACPCALGLATPIAVMVAAGRAAKEGIIFRSGAAMENAGRATVAVLDKTGTLTLGRPKVCGTLPIGISEKELLQLAAALESTTNHPYAAAVCAAAPQNIPFRAENIIPSPGRGVQATVNGFPCAAGSALFMKDLGIDISSVDLWDIPAIASPLYVACKGSVCGVIAVAAPLRSSATDAVKELRHCKMRIIMVTGDNSRTANACAKVCGIDRVHAEVKPQGKVELVEELRAMGENVLMIGDGINDAPALAAADTSMAVGMGTDAALNSAGIILSQDELACAARAVKLSREVTQNIRRNLFWAFIYNVIAIPVAAGAFYPLFHWTPTPAMAAGFMCLSSLSVVFSALSLRKRDEDGETHESKGNANEGY